ncbi:MAG: AAA family ATPase [Chlamydiae bacterium SM23_39]|nr:MAG: AAA family ATPase [Chlamydiae bacterium SM23_39]
MENNNKPFGKIRSILWPIHTYELKKLLPMFIMFFFISFNYTILRDTKDSLIVTAPHSGAETIPFLKVWGVIPCAIIFMVIFAKISNKLSKRALFNVTLIPFLAFFAIFAFALYPIRDLIHPNNLADKLQQMLPQGFMGLIAVFRNWSFSLFYILSELWGSVALSLLFWGFANDIMKVTEAKRFYSILGLGANLALLVSGPAIVLASNISQKLPPHIDAWGVSLNYLMTIVVIAGVIIIGIYNWMHKYVLTDTRFYNPNKDGAKKKEKLKMSLKESFLYLIKSKYLGLLAILVISYGLCINIVEVTWKNQLKLQFTNGNDYNTFMGIFSMSTGLITSFMMLFVGGNVIRKFGWGKTAKITPIILGITGSIFFLFVIFRTKITLLLSLTTSPLFITVILGAIQNIMSKSSKYSLFDPTKEMAYIPLDDESKVKGKAAVDVVAARLGKGGGSILQQILIVNIGTLIVAAPFNLAILVIVVAIWLFSANALKKLFLEKTKEQEETKIVAQEITN